MAVLAFAALGAACGDDEDEDEAAAPETTAPATSSAAASSEAAADGAALTIYSGRSEDLVAPLFEQFAEATGIEVEVRYADSAELAATLVEEGGNSPADVYFAQDAGALGAVAEAGLLAPLPATTTELVDARYRDGEGRWVGVSGRSRVIAYNTDELQPEDVPTTVAELIDPKWRGKVGLPPTNASFQAFVSAMRLVEGDDATREWLDALKANDVRFYEGNGAVLEAVGAGEIQLGLINHYYLFEAKAENPDLPAANAFLTAGDPGALVNVAGVGVLETSDQAEAAQQLVDYLLSTEGQTFFAEQTSEYPLVAGVPTTGELPPMDEIQGPDIALGDLGGQLERTLEMLAEAGYTA